MGLKVVKSCSYKGDGSYSLVHILLLYDVTFRRNTLLHKQTERRTERRTDDSIMPRVDHTGSANKTKFGELGPKPKS